MCGSASCCIAESRLVAFSRINGVPLKYRFSSGWGFVTVRSKPGFQRKLNNWMGTLSLYSKTYGGKNFNSITWIGTAGAFTRKRGCHGRGRALDLNYIRWNNYTLNIFRGAHGASKRGRRRRYLAVDACCRQYFKFTLDGWYNAAHTNHIHIDNHTVPILNRGSRSDTVFVQSVCNNFNGAGLAIDGDWGPGTQSAFAAINRKWGFRTAECNPFRNKAHYREWLALVMKHGFKNAAAGYYKSSC